MVLIWIGIAVGILIAVILIYKVSKSSSNEYVTIRCKQCGIKTNGLKCPICESNKGFGK